MTIGILVFADYSIATVQNLETPEGRKAYEALKKLSDFREGHELLVEMPESGTERAAGEAL